MYCIVDTSRTSNRFAYQDQESNLYLDCIQCGITRIEEFGESSKGFLGKRSECTPCRRRTKNERARIGEKVILQVYGESIECNIHDVSQHRRFAYIDGFEIIYFQCTECDDYKPLNDFYNDKLSFMGKQSNCKKCINIKNRIYDDEHTEHLKAKAHERYIENIEVVREKNKAYREENKVVLAKKKKEYAARDKRAHFERGRASRVRTAAAIKKRTKNSMH